MWGVFVASFLSKLFSVKTNIRKLNTPAHALIELEFFLENKF